MPKDPCSELAKTITELAMNIGARPEVKNLDDVVKHMQELVPQIDRTTLVASINEATTGYAKAREELAKKLDRMRREARSDVSLRGKIAAMEKALKAGELMPTTARTTAEPGPSVAALKERSAELQAAIRRSDAAIKKRYLTDIENLTDRLENGVFTLPEPKVKRPLNQELDAIQYKRDKLRDEIRAHTESLKPKTIFDLAAAPLSDARAVMTAYDVSAVLRQGGFVALGNPVRAAKALPDMFRSLASGEKAYHINKAIFERENAPLYHRAGLFLSETGHSGLGKQEELFVSKWAKLIPGVKASERAYVAFLNKIRADTFDSMAASLAKDGNPTIAEMEAIANFINVATGRGKLHGSIEKAADALNKTLFAPRYVASRFQLMSGQPLYGGSAATRKLIIREYAKFITGAGVVLGLGTMAGGDVELDPRSSDFGKIRFGETRLDPFGGLTQAVTLASRLATGKYKNAKGELESAYGEGARQDASTTIGRFLRSKLAPFPGAVLDSLSGKNIVGEPTTPVDAATRMVTPMSVRDIYEAVKEQGVPAGTAMSLISLFGVSMNTYGPRTDTGDLMGDLEDAGLETSPIYASMKRLRTEYQDATKDRRVKIQEQLDKLNTAARKTLKAKQGK